MQKDDKSDFYDMCSRVDVKHSEAHLTSKNRSSKNLLSCHEALYMYHVCIVLCVYMCGYIYVCACMSNVRNLPSSLRSPLPAP